MNILKAINILIKKGVFNMKIVSLNLPDWYAVKILLSELHSYSFNEEAESLIYLKEFSYGEHGDVEANVEMYPMKKDHPLAKLFTITNPMIPGMKVFDTEEYEKRENKEAACKLLNSIVVDLMEYCENTTCVKTNTPLFDMHNVTPDMCTDNDNSTHIPKDLNENDIVIPIPTEPPVFDDPSRLDRED